MIYLLQHTAGLGFLVALLWLPGYVLERGGPTVDVRLRQLARLALGISFWIVCLFVLMALGLLRPWSLWVVVALVILGVWMTRRRSDRPRVQFPALARLPASGVLAFGLLVALLAPFFFLAMSPPVSWDASAYHLTVAKLFVNHGGFREVPFNVYSYWPLNIQLLFAMAMILDGYPLAKLLHFAFGAATLYALYAGCRTFHLKASGVVAMGLFVANGVVAYELRVAYVDLAYAFFFLAGFLFMIAALEHGARNLWLAGLCCGILAGIKITGIVGGAVIGALYLPRLVGALVDSVRRRDGDPAWRPFLIRFVLPVLALWTPWLARTAWLTGNPFYPFFHDRLGGPDWSSALTAQFQAWQSSIGMGRTPIDYLLLPVRTILAGGEGYHRFDGEVGAFWLVVLLLALWGGWRVPLARRGLGAAGLYFVFWSLSSQQMRFLIPALTLLAIAGGVAVVELLALLPSTSWRRAGYALTALAFATVMIADHGLLLAAGYRTVGVYLRAGGDLEATAVHPVYRFINATLPPEAKLLFLNTNQAFFCDREVIADSFFEASQISAWLAPAANAEEVRRLLESRGVSHVLVENRHRGAVYPASLGELLRDPGRAQLLHRSEDERFSVFELRSRL